mmetsp:Transcript_16883/g.42936  ORF Transcript_16883/g.42936 Transcript_16883/m.42936 type:complete len:214 (-) Transcript_16883:104-745(-)
MANRALAVTPANQGDELALRVDDWELGDLVLQHQGLSLAIGHWLRCREHIFDHDAVQWLLMRWLVGLVTHRVEVSARDQAYEAAAHAAVVGNGYTAATDLPHDLLRVAYGRPRPQGGGVQDERRFVFLDLADHGRLLLDGLLLVDDADAACEGQRDRHVLLRDRRRRWADERHVQANVLRESRCEFFRLIGRGLERRQKGEVIKATAMCCRTP